jgi:AcrR family transcriptional regulator
MKETFQKLPGEKQLAILTAAAGIFARDGYHAASIDNICRSAGISNGALYKYFRNKEDLFLTVIDQGIELVREFYRQFDPAGPVLGILERIFNGITRTVPAEGTAVSIYLDLCTCSLNRFAEKKSGPLEQVGRDFLSGLLENAAARGEIPRGLDIPAAVYFIDNLVLSYSFSMVSAHYRRRLLVFMNEGKDVPEKRKVAFMLRAVRQMLAAPGISKNKRGKRT